MIAMVFALFLIAHNIDSKDDDSILSRFVGVLLTIAIGFHLYKGARTPIDVTVKETVTITKEAPKSVED